MARAIGRPSPNLPDDAQSPVSIQRRLARLERTYLSFFYWFALQCKTENDLKNFTLDEAMPHELEPRFASGGRNARVRAADIGV